MPNSSKWPSKSQDPSQQQQQTTTTASNTMSNQLENIKVAVRLRPFTQKERERNNRRIVDIQENTVVLYNLNYSDVQLKKFTFDYSYWSHDGFKRDENGVNVPDPAHPNCGRYVGQDKVFEDLGSFLLKNALEGYNSALLAYGQTGSGKSYTVSGYGQNEGILPRFARALFIELERKRSASDAQASDSSQPSTTTTTGRYEVYFSMIEIYNEVVRDLLAKNHSDIVMGQQQQQASASLMVRRGLKVREHPKYGFFVENLSSFPCANKEEIERRIEEGQLNKSIAATSMNEMSSRGHTIYEFRIKQYSSSSSSSDSSAPADETLTTSVVQLVDLAGSERMAVHVTGRIGGDTFIGSRSNTPHPRTMVDKPSARPRASKAAGASVAPTSASSSNESASNAAGQQQQQQSQKANQSTPQQQQMPSIAGSATHMQRFKESVAINQSLSALGNCIQVLSQYSQQLEMQAAAAGANNPPPKKPAPKIPYRDSVLTKLLNRCCLSGNSRVVLIATLSPIDTNYDDTLSTLRFADRAKRIRTHACINKVERSEIMNADAARNKRRANNTKDSKSDHSSQTSNFDDNENVEENFSGTKIVGQQQQQQKAKGAGAEASAASTSRTNNSRHKTITRRAGPRSTATASRSLAAKQEQMKRIVSPASPRDLLASSGSEPSNRPQAATQQYSRSKSRRRAPSSEDATTDDLLEEEEENGNEDEDETPDELNELDDIEEGLFSSVDSDDDVISLSAFRLDADGSEDMTTDEKIQLFNKMLSSSSLTALDVASGQSPGGTGSKSKRPRRSNNRPAERATIQRVPGMISSSLKKDNPYLSNLNPDEQLTGVIGYIIKQGETIVGKSKECDIVLHGPELRRQHARLIRDSDNTVYIEPILGESNDSSAATLMVNGTPINGGGERVQLNHCDRLLFGTNAYFVFANNLAASNSSKAGQAGTLADLDMVTYEMARNEVLRKYMAGGKNEAMLKEISEYTHRPGTGKHRIRSADVVAAATTKSSTARLAAQSSISTTATDASAGKLLRETIEERSPGALESPTRRSAGNSSLMPTAEGERPFVEKSTFSSQSLRVNISEAPKDQTKDIEQSVNLDEDRLVEDQERIYRERLMEDTYEYTLPVAEINAVAKEMGVKVQYGLKILIGEEQLTDQLTNNNLQTDSSSDKQSVSSSSAGGQANNSSESVKNATSNNFQVAPGSQEQSLQAQVTRLNRLDDLDISPALYVRVHLDEFGLDFYWSKEKFDARRFKILELYGLWDVAGKSGLVEHLIDQSKYQGDYLIDPFVDDPASTFVLIGHAQITLTPISHLSHIEENFDIIDMDDGVVGNVRIEAVPCDSSPLPGAQEAAGTSKEEARSTSDTSQPPYRVFGESELEQCLLNSPREMLNKKLVFRLTIKSCHNLPDRYHNIFCQYQLGSELPIIRTKMMRESPQASDVDQVSSNNSEPKQTDDNDELAFDHSHFICFDRVDQDILDFLEHGFLTIQIVGQYRLSPEEQQKAPTVISTIISSINKYKMKIEQQQQQQHSGAFSSAGADYQNGRAGGAFFGSQTGSSKSHRGQSSSGAMNSNSASSVVSTSATVNLFDRQNDDEDGSNSINSLSQENIIDMILTKRKLDRAENQLHYLKRTINIAELYNKKHIPLKTIKKLLNSYGQELESGSLEEFADVTAKARTSNNKSSACSIQ